MTIKEGYMPYLDYKTYYRIVGKENKNKKPLVLLHGGPGSTHNYFELLDRIAKEDDRQLIMYDQLGCGLSSMPDDPSLWKASTWIDELIALREHLNLDEIHLLGQSWGGMMVIDYLCAYEPKGLKSAILSSTLPSSKLWGEEQHRLIKYLSKEDQEAIRIAEETNDFTSEAYLTANDHFMVRHAADNPSPELPEPLRRKKNSGSQAYLYAWGPNEYTPSGTLKDFYYVDQLHTIDTPTLITSGADDLCTPYIAKLMHDKIPNSQWELYQHSRHMPFVDQIDEYVPMLIDWLNKHD
ncbi:MAG: proline iminopeptidase-family hydrolase [Vagococcus sp.]|uniref:proline iminopeptidase n=1 Tax=Vagococcus sp. TaxID=1933889 RepID=UPI002FCB8009